MSYKINPFNCGYVAASEIAIPTAFGFVSLYNNDSLWRVVVVHDVARISSAAGFAGYEVAQGQVGASPVNASPAITGEQNPKVIATIGSSSSSPTITLRNGVQSGQPGWTHDFPLIVLRQGYRLTAWASVVNVAFDFGFWFQLVDSRELLGIEEQPTLVIPKVLKLSVETE